MVKKRKGCQKIAQHAEKNTHPYSHFGAIEARDKILLFVNYFTLHLQRQLQKQKLQPSPCLLYVGLTDVSLPCLTLTAYGKRHAYTFGNVGTICIRYSIRHKACLQRHKCRNALCLRQMLLSLPTLGVK